MFDQEGDAMSVYSASSRIPSLVMPPGMSMQDYYKALEIHAAELNAANAQQVGATRRQRRNSDSSVMSDTERLYGWSGSRGGISNNEQGPKYRINSQGHLVLAEELQRHKKEGAAAAAPLQANSNPAAVLGANNNSNNNNTGATPTKPALRSARSDGPKPMYRPAFAPSAVLPPSSDEEIDEDDRVIQHDLPSTRPLKARPSLKQKLGSLVARVGSVRRGGLASPPVSTAGGAGATSPGGGKTPTEDPAPAKDYLSVKRATSSAAAYGRRTRPDFARKGSALAGESTPEEGADADIDTKVAPVDATSTQPHLTFTDANDENKTPTPSPGLKHDDDKAYLSADGGAFAGGMVSLARKLSRRATTGDRNRSRSVPRNLREEREKQADQLQDKEAAEKMLKEQNLFRPREDPALQTPSLSSRQECQTPLLVPSPRTFEDFL
ncbi:hypothetical protein P389DRAFT_94033 [Cystobasidium minutum MCA 4210]|uniref:uncharacterized protein n=1 Tax=Cystobasidium minutum MCA 4210 TaxID=1397322 RepID=UPI0034CD60C5|eukprot:jgi/Rhomi1/94033/CE94032_1247